MRNESSTARFGYERLPHSGANLMLRSLVFVSVATVVGACGLLPGAALPNIADAGFCAIPPGLPDPGAPHPQHIPMARGIAGADLHRVTIDLDAHPEARCNDGTPGVFYVRPAPALTP